MELRKSFAGKHKSTFRPLSKSRQKKVTLGPRKRSGQQKMILGPSARSTKPELTLFCRFPKFGMDFFCVIHIQINSINSNLN
jgi:hypothetical protein